jgi:hypothetical protein
MIGALQVKRVLAELAVVAVQLEQLNVRSKIERLMRLESAVERRLLSDVCFTTAVGWKEVTAARVAMVGATTRLNDVTAQRPQNVGPG